MSHAKDSLRRVILNVTVMTLAIGCVLAIGWLPVQAQTFSVLHTFTGGSDGANPRAGLTIDQAGNLLGTAFSGGGSNNAGVAFKFVQSNGGWVLIPLYEFPNSHLGGSPDSLLLQTDNGIYGTTYHDGIGDNGSVFRLQPAASACKAALCYWSAAALYKFTGSPDGSVPIGGVSFDQAGNLFGSTQYGGIGSYNPGTIYELTPASGSWIETQLYSFTGGADGSYINGVIMGTDGNLYGTALYGGFNDQGTVFELVNSGSGWTLKVLHTFQGVTDGKNPAGGLTFDQAGNLYGTTAAGGKAGGGTVFELTPSSNGEWTLSTLFGFAGLEECGPYAAVTLDSAGNIWGTTYCSGAYTAGTVFKLTYSNGTWTNNQMHVFTDGSDGGYPFSTVTLDANGNAYGTTLQGGIRGADCDQTCGVLWQISP